MIHEEIAKFTDMDYSVLGEESTTAVIFTPYIFEDLDPVYIYFEVLSPTEVRFDDFAEVVSHFRGRGFLNEDFTFCDEARAFLEKTAENRGLTFTGRTLYLEGPRDESEALFKRYLKAMFDILEWEKEQVFKRTEEMKKWLDKMSA